MVVATKNKLLGSRRRTEVLVLLGLLGESYPSELARVLGAPLYSVQKLVYALTQEEVVATRMIGRERHVALNPKFPAAPELRMLLGRLAESEPELQKAVEQVRHIHRPPGI